MKEAATIDEPLGDLRSYDYSPDGKTIALAHANRVSVWDAAKRRQVWSVALPGNAFQVSYAPDGKHLVTANANGTADVLRLPPETLGGPVGSEPPGK